MKEDQESKGNLELKEWIQSAVIAIVLAFIIKMFLFDFVMVQGSSMFPTLVEGDRLIVNKIGYTIGEPDYGDIVILSYSDSVEYVKRVIGKGGDTIEIKDMVVYRNGEPLSEDYINTDPYEDFSEVTVPTGTYFVMGDNRANSSDSRYSSLGFVERDAIDGKVIFRIWPLSEIGLV
ncbi:signal peptidase I [Acetobacterium malicum]|uniref:Signal peptidase I n=1 Tax=Acetobacterium malicum TaxID=52692 RepID=A0ABR6YT64_9FIRM|nr:MULTISPECIES: signal peptidase I [Acetobacterium]MBC3898370.1 signal peptidase I [Acetobacterium malicum]